MKEKKTKKKQSNKTILSDRKTLVAEGEMELQGRPRHRHLCEYGADKDTHSNVMQTWQK